MRLQHKMILVGKRNVWIICETIKNNYLTKCPQLRLNPCSLRRFTHHVTHSVTWIISYQDECKYLVTHCINSYLWNISHITAVIWSIWDCQHHFPFLEGSCAIIYSMHFGHSENLVRPYQLEGRRSNATHKQSHGNLSGWLANEGNGWRSARTDGEQTQTAVMENLFVEKKCEQKSKVQTQASVCSHLNLWLIRSNQKSTVLFNLQRNIKEVNKWKMENVLGDI